MKKIFQALLILGMIYSGLSQAQDWGTDHSSSPRFKAENHGWVASTQSRKPIFNPIVLPSVNIVPHVRVNPHYSSYKDSQRDNGVQFRYLDTGRSR